MRLHHVQLAIPSGGEERARHFWIDVVGFTEIPKPEPLASRGGLWLRSGDAEIHLGLDDPFVPATRAHPALVTDDLDDLARRLELHGHETVPDAAFRGYRRLHTSDPFGNRIEFMSLDT